MRVIVLRSVACKKLCDGIVFVISDKGIEKAFVMSSCDVHIIPANNADGIVKTSFEQLK